MSIETLESDFMPRNILPELGVIKHALIYPNHEKSIEMHSGLRKGLTGVEFRVGLEASFLVSDMFACWLQDRVFAQRICDRIYPEQESKVISTAATNALKKLDEPTREYYQNEVRKVMDKSMNLRSYALWFRDQLEFYGFVEPIKLEFLHQMSNKRQVQKQKYKLYEL